jgi:hypothetical protein
LSKSSRPAIRQRVASGMRKQERQAFGSRAKTVQLLLPGFCIFHP